MFQYAIGRVLASRHATEHLLDTRLLNRYDMHNGFELKRVFDIPARVATEDEIKSLIELEGQPLEPKTAELRFLGLA